VTVARRLWAALDVLDRQLVDREGRFAGTVDDVELTQTDEGTMLVTALLAGPGVLARRMRHPVYGAWMERFVAWAMPDATDPTRIPIGRVADLGSHITVSLDHMEMGTAAMERWFRDHIIEHIPGSRHAAE
jgi:hypothetical protein